ncbi:MAG: hypothetical protein IMZ61_06535 [Planctomycetes bacterium]|nr:hypothetical protein [Planctomycetota bacterium]
MDFHEVTAQDIEFMAKNSLCPEIYKHREEQIDYCFALSHEDKTLGIGGFRMITNTTYFTWFDLSKAAYENNIIVCYRTIREKMESFAKEKGIILMMAYVRVGFEAGIHTAQHLGFNLECRLNRFLGEDPADLYLKYFGD